MRAFAIPEAGSAPDVIDIDTPEPAEGEVRVRIHAASVNGFDLAVANGYLAGVMEHRFPLVLGKDFAGTIDAIGPGVTGYDVGDRVFGVVTKPHLGDGSFAEAVTVPVAVGLAPLPESVGFVEGATLGLAGAAARAVVDAAELGPVGLAGRTVLVSGATGGVGNQVVQLAAASGARVIATASAPAERDLVTRYGAEAVVDHTDDVAAVRKSHPDGVDVVFHLAGDPVTLLGTVRHGGTFVSTIIQSPEQLPTSDATVVGVYANPDPDTLARLANDRASGATQVTVQRTYDLAESTTALADFAAGTLGKLVITLR